MDDWTRVLLYGTFDGLNLSSDGSRDILVTLENGDRVDIHEYLVRKASDFVEKDKLKLKDVIARIKKLDFDSQEVWLNGILNELGSDYGILKYKTGYEQGRFEGEYVGQQLKDADKVRQELNKPVVKQFVADWYEENKVDFEGNLFRCIDCIPGLYDEEELNDFEEWVIDSRTKPFQTLVNMHQFGYEVEKEKRYEVILSNGQSLKTVYRQGEDRLDFEKVYGDLERFTRKQLEDAGLAWVFDCPGIEIEEVEE